MTKNKEYYETDPVEEMLRKLDRIVTPKKSKKKNKKIKRS